MVTARAMAELKAPTLVKSKRPIRMYWADEGQIIETNNKHNAESTKDNTPKSEDWEHKLEVEECLKKYKMYKEGTKAKVWAENKGKCCYLILQHCPPELKTELKNLARWEAAAADTDVVVLLLII